MKKTIIIATLLGLFCAPYMAIAKSINDEYLPETCKFSIGLDLTPLLNFAGNIFNGTSDQTLDDIGGEPISVINTTITQPTVSFIGRYMIYNDLAIRANIGVMISNQTNNYYVVDDSAVALDPLSTSKVIDSESTSSRGGSIAVAVEKRLGERRIQGVFSAGVVYGFATTSIKYNYGNGITEINQIPTTNSDNYTTVSTAMPNVRITNDYLTSGSHAVGLVTSLGFEYFVAPKVSIGAEVNIVAIYSFTNGQAAQYEGYNTYTKKVETHTELVSPRSSSFLFGTENIGGNLGMHFYF